MLELWQARVHFDQGSAESAGPQSHPQRPRNSFAIHETFKRFIKRESVCVVGVGESGPH